MGTLLGDIACGGVLSRIQKDTSSFECHYCGIFITCVLELLMFLHSMSESLLL